ncbi:MAG TPA: hypothetical protein HPP66_14505 [Planctomycetes bacterium]|nr:hypothetical protein [Planctomycetota bacterium]
MNRLQKLAWFNLKVVAVGGSVSLLTIAISLAAGEVVISYLGFLILAVTALIMALSPLLVRKEPGRVTFDERDATIEKKAHYVGYCILWCVFIVTCLIAIPTAGFAILATALVTVQLVQSVATLLQYGRRGKENE